MNNTGNFSRSFNIIFIKYFKVISFVILFNSLAFGSFFEHKSFNYLVIGQDYFCETNYVFYNAILDSAELQLSKNDTLLIFYETNHDLINYYLFSTKHDVSNVVFDEYSAFNNAFIKKVIALAQEYKNIILIGSGSSVNPVNFDLLHERWPSYFSTDLTYNIKTIRTLSTFEKNHLFTELILVFSKIQSSDLYLREKLYLSDLIGRILLGNDYKNSIFSSIISLNIPKKLIFTNFNNTSKALNFIKYHELSYTPVYLYTKEHKQSKSKKNVTNKFFSNTIKTGFNSVQNGDYGLFDFNKGKYVLYPLKQNDILFYPAAWDL